MISAHWPDLIGLETLRLDNNLISDIGPLAELTNLKISIWVWGYTARV